MFNDFLRGMGSINLFPKERKMYFAPPLHPILDDEEAFKKDMEMVGQDMWNAIKIIKKEHPECK